MHRLRSARAVVAVLLIAVGLALGAALLPDDPYQRWQLLDGTIHADARWVYERTHFDPTPVDVVFIGPSRMEKGVDAPRLERALAAQGLPHHVINASLPQEGRDIADVMVREILAAKHPRLIVLGVTEKPSRLGHPAFKYIAPAGEVIAPHAVPELRYLSNLVYLPYRQLRLFAARLVPAADHLTPRFDPARYGGESVETAGSRMLGDGKFQHADLPGDPREVAQKAAQFAASMHPPLLHGALERWEFADERDNIADIAALAQAHGVKLAFLYLPYYGAAPQLTEGRFYQRFGPLWTPPGIAQDISLYGDYGHLDLIGAHKLTDWLAPLVAAQLASPGDSRASPPAAASTPPGATVKVAAGFAHGSARQPKA